MKVCRNCIKHPYKVSWFWTFCSFVRLILIYTVYMCVFTNSYTYGQYMMRTKRMNLILAVIRVYKLNKYPAGFFSDIRYPAGWWKSLSGAPALKATSLGSLVTSPNHLVSGLSLRPAARPAERSGTRMDLDIGLTHWSEIRLDKASYWIQYADFEARIF